MDSRIAGLAGDARAAPEYDIHVLGFTDAEHTSPIGSQSSSVIGMNQAGQVTGSSARYAGNPPATGRSAWLYRDGELINIGLIDAEHTNPNGTRRSEVQDINEAGQAIGFAFRNGVTQAGTLGQSAWLYDGTTTLNIGLTDAQHTNPVSGYRRSVAMQLNEAGQVLGYSSLYNGNEQNGDTPWLYDGGVTRPLGFTDAVHTSPAGFHPGRAIQLNEAGYAIGETYRYNGNASGGQSVWLDNGSGAVRPILARRHGCMTPHQARRIPSSFRHCRMAARTATPLTLARMA